MKDQYSMKYKCGNCGYGFEQSFFKGVKAIQGECPNCGCNPSQVYGNPWGEN